MDHDLQEPLLNYAEISTKDNAAFTALSKSEGILEKDIVTTIDDVEDFSSSAEDSTDTAHPFSARVELVEIYLLGYPLAISFFCRMGMASTDSAFVGHINDGTHSAEAYLAAAVIGNMCTTLLTAPPCAFNKILNALVGQAMGGSNPKMAGVWLQQSWFWLTLSMLPFLVVFFYVEPILIGLGFTQDLASLAGKYSR
mmetsp:Transcript_19325/g.44037  ORF Transcript_19325/g.44037 Transcript_19325/m.44037 type:complete len:197 (+) Transcript_19325:70-660(+)